MIKVDSIFPLPVMIVNLGSVLNEEMTNEIEFLDNKANDPSHTEGNVINVISKDYTVLNGLKLKPVIQEYIDHYSTQILGESPKLGITGSWLNLNRPGDSHHKHYHPNSKVSGCLYMNVDDDSGDFLIYRPQYMEETFRDGMTNGTQFNWSHMIYNPKKYDLYLFPSKLYHSVTENKSTINRTSVAFNIFYDETIGSRAEILRR
jgi:uncharacterized protein (TIGR02466 family)